MLFSSLYGELSYLVGKSYRRDLIQAYYIEELSFPIFHMLAIFQDFIVYPTCVSKINVYNLLHVVAKHALFIIYSISYRFYLQYIELFINMSKSCIQVRLHF